MTEEIWSRQESLKPTENELAETWGEELQTEFIAGGLNVYGNSRTWSPIQSSNYICEGYIQALLP